MYNAFNCTLDRQRGQHDQWNSVIAGGLTGALFRCTGKVLSYSHHLPTFGFYFYLTDSQTVLTWDLSPLVFVNEITVAATCIHSSSWIPKDVHCFFTNGGGCHGLVSRQTKTDSQISICQSRMSPVSVVLHSFYFCVSLCLIFIYHANCMPGYQYRKAALCSHTTIPALAKKMQIYHLDWQHVQF
jgi:hypothetical protein